MTSIGSTGTTSNISNNAGIQLAEAIPESRTVEGYFYDECRKYGFTRPHDEGGIEDKRITGIVSRRTHKEMLERGLRRLIRVLLCEVADSKHDSTGNLTLNDNMQEEARVKYNLIQIESDRFTGADRWKDEPRSARLFLSGQTPSGPSYPVPAPEKDFLLELAFPREQIETDRGRLSPVFVCEKLEEWNLIHEMWMLQVGMEICPRKNEQSTLHGTCPGHNPDRFTCWWFTDKQFPLRQDYQWSLDPRAKQNRKSFGPPTGLAVFRIILRYRWKEYFSLQEMQQLIDRCCDMAGNFTPRICEPLTTGKSGRRYPAVGKGKLTLWPKDHMVFRPRGYSSHYETDLPWVVVGGEKLRVIEKSSRTRAGTFSMQALRSLIPEGSVLLIGAAELPEVRFRRGTTREERDRKTGEIIDETLAKLSRCFLENLVPILLSLHHLQAALLRKDELGFSSVRQILGQPGRILPCLVPRLEEAVQHGYLKTSREEQELSAVTTKKLSPTVRGLMSLAIRNPSPFLSTVRQSELKTVGRCAPEMAFPHRERILRLHRENYIGTEKEMNTCPYAAKLHRTVRRLTEDGLIMAWSCDYETWHELDYTKSTDRCYWRNRMADSDIDHVPESPVIILGNETSAYDPYPDRFLARTAGEYAALCPGAEYAPTPLLRHWYISPGDDPYYSRVFREAEDFRTEKGLERRCEVVDGLLDEGYRVIVNLSKKHSVRINPWELDTYNQLYPAGFKVPAPPEISTLIKRTLTSLLWWPCDRTYLKFRMLNTNHPEAWKNTVRKEDEDMIIQLEKIFTRPFLIKDTDKHSDEHSDG